MAVFVLEARDFTSPLFLVRTWEVLLSGATFSLVASSEPRTANNTAQTHHSLATFCLFTWCFFFCVSLLIHVLSTIQFHSLLPLSWKNLVVAVAVLGACMSLSAAAVFPWLVMDDRKPAVGQVAAAVTAGLTFAGYAFESCLLLRRSPEQRGYMGSKPGLLKTMQAWGGCFMAPLVAEVAGDLPGGVRGWWLWVPLSAYGTCLALSLLMLTVIVGDLATRICLPFERILAGFSLVGVLLYTVATVICFTRILQLEGPQHAPTPSAVQLLVLETVVASVTLLAYTVDLAFCIKLLCDRGH